MSHHPLLWVDVETNGLFEGESPPLLLEVGLVHTDAELRVLWSKSVVIRTPRWKVLERMSPEVFVMHEASGLLDEVERSTLTLEAAEQDLMDHVLRHSAKGLYMAGSGISFDRRVLGVHMPALLGFFHYRNVDLTTLRYFFGSEKGPVAHRALPDCEQSLQQLREYVARARTCGLLSLPVTV